MTNDNVVNPDNTRFVDNEGDSWELRIDVNALERVRDSTGIPLAESVDEGSDILPRIERDPILMVKVLYSILEPQINARSITPEEFAARIVGDAISEAVKAFLYGLIYFFPRARREPLILLLEQSLASTERMSRLLDGPQFRNAIESEARRQEEELKNRLASYSDDESLSASES